MHILDNTVATNFTGLKSYPDNVPFNPPEKFPEYTGSDIDPDNQVYAEVRKDFL